MGFFGRSHALPVSGVLPTRTRASASVRALRDRKKAKPGTTTAAATSSVTSVGIHTLLTRAVGEIKTGTTGALIKRAATDHGADLVTRGPLRPLVNRSGFWRGQQITRGAELFVRRPSDRIGLPLGGRLIAPGRSSELLHEKLRKATAMLRGVRSRAPILTSGDAGITIHQRRQLRGPLMLPKGWLAPKSAPSADVVTSAAPASSTVPILTDRLEDAPAEERIQRAAAAQVLNATAAEAEPQGSSNGMLFLLAAAVIGFMVLRKA